MWTATGVAGAWAAYVCGHFLLSSREMALLHSDQIQITNNHYVTRAAVLEVFVPDRGGSILRVPLEERRKQIEALPWVSQATIRRALPNTLEVDVVERTPIAFLREEGELSLVDAHGVILENPVSDDFHFPVVTGINANMPLDDRERRMQLFAGFIQGVQTAKLGAGDNVSEVNLADEHDVRAMITGLQPAPKQEASGAGIDAPLLVHFGDSDFQAKYATLLEKIGEVRAKTGPLDSLDLRFNGELVANPDLSVVAQKTTLKPKLSAASAKHSR